jgi:nitrate reductase NapE component
MERIRSADRSQLIRFSMVVFALLALVSFALAGVVG